MIPIGTLVNAGAVLAGSSIGLLLKGRISERLSGAIIRAIGLCVIVIGVSGAMNGDFMLLVASLALGALIGELIDIDKGLNNVGNALMRSPRQFEDKGLPARVDFCCKDGEKVVE